MLDLAVHAHDPRLAIGLDLVAAAQQLQHHRNEHIPHCRSEAQYFRLEIVDEAAPCPRIGDDGGRRPHRDGGRSHLSALEECGFGEARRLPDIERHVYSAAWRFCTRPLNRGITSSVNSFTDRIAASCSTPGKCDQTSRYCRLRTSTIS